MEFKNYFQNFPQNWDVWENTNQQWVILANLIWEHCYQLLHKPDNKLVFGVFVGKVSSSDVCVLRKTPECHLSYGFQSLTRVKWHFLETHFCQEKKYLNRLSVFHVFYPGWGQVRLRRFVQSFIQKNCNKVKSKTLVVDVEWSLYLFEEDIRGTLVELPCQSLDCLQVHLKNVEKCGIPKTQTNSSVESLVFHFGHVSHFHHKLVYRLHTHQLMVRALEFENFDQLGH